MKLKTINVVVDPSGGGEGLPALHAFTADDKGRKQAKECFREIAKNRGYGTDEQIEQAIVTCTLLVRGDGNTIEMIESEWNPFIKTQVTQDTVQSKIGDDIPV